MIFNLKKYVPNRRFSSGWNIFFLLLFLFSFGTKAEKQLLPFKDFREDWLVYDANKELFLPYIPSLHLNYQSKSIIIQKNQFFNSFLQFNTKMEFDLFVNGTYYKKIPATFAKPEKELLSIDQLKKEFPSNQLVLTLYNPNLHGLPEGINLVKYREVSKNLEFNSRYGVNVPNILSISLLIIIIYLIFIQNNFRNSFINYFSFQDWVLFSNKNPIIYNSPFDLPNFSFLIILSIIVSLLTLNNQYFLSKELMSAQQLNQTFQNYSIIWSLIKYFGIALVLFGTRYIIYFLIGSILNIPKIVKLHYFKNLQTNFQFYFLAFLVFLILIIVNGPNSRLNIELFQVSVGIFYLIRAVYYYFYFRKNLEIPNFILIGYLLLTEGQIGFFGIRSLLFNQFVG